LSVLTTDQKGIVAEMKIAAVALAAGVGVASRWGRRPYLPGEIDAIVGYCAETEGCYYLPAELSVERTAVQLRLAPTRNNQVRRIQWARDFELGATLARLQGPIAQLGERLRGTQKVAGSSPAGSTLGAA
jgi:hypothetical protein